MSSSEPDIDCACDSRSPQMSQSFPSSGFRAEIHSSQTGNREMLVRKALQRRHSEGKIVANRLSAMPRSQDAGSLSRAALSVATARVRSPVLLKTNLPRPGTSPRKRPAGRVGYQYIGAALCDANKPSNRGSWNTFHPMIQTPRCNMNGCGSWRKPCPGSSPGRTF